uniref:(northern house mosquito) hypothetical protein n=1 Tax=Culex pipiens TaxID=7175 RepID=A0A8D8G337_CULPI
MQFLTIFLLFTLLPTPTLLCSIAAALLDDQPPALAEPFAKLLADLDSNTPAAVWVWVALLFVALLLLMPLLFKITIALFWRLLLLLLLVNVDAVGQEAVATRLDLWWTVSVV